MPLARWSRPRSAGAVAAALVAVVSLVVALLAASPPTAAGSAPARGVESFPGQNGLIAFDSELVAPWAEEIWLAHPVDGTHVRLTVEGGWFPAWSPDGDELAFVSARGNDSADLFRVQADGTDLERLSDNGVQEFSPAWSPDGTTIVYDRIAPTSGTSELWMMDADGRHKRPFPSPVAGSGAAFSPDGTKIAFSSDRDGAGLDVYVMDVDGSDVVRLTEDPADDFGPDWSPDGTTIAFSSSRDGDFDLYTMTPAGGSLTHLTIESSQEMAPVWSPDGTKLAMVLEDANGGARHVGVIDADGTDLVALTPDDFILGVDWQPVAQLDTSDPTITITSPAASGLTFENDHAPLALFACTDAVPGSGVRRCVAEVAKPNGAAVELEPGEPLPSHRVGSYEVRLEALDWALNRATEVRPYTVVDDYQPDGRIALGTGPYVGNDVYDPTLVNQTRTTTARLGATVTFNLSIQNDGEVSDAFRLRANADPVGYRVRYFRVNPDGTSGENVTSAVTAGTFVTPVLGPVQSVKVRAVVTVLSTAPAGSSVTRSVKITSVGFNPDKDVVGFTVRRA